MNSTSNIATLTRDHLQLANRLDLLAGDLDALAERVERWGNLSYEDAFSPLTALGLINTGDTLADRGRSILGSDLIGDKTRSSHGNEASIALGVSWHGKGSNTSSLAYGLFYALSQHQKYGAPTRTVESRTAVKASSIRVYAASARVVADISRGVAAGKYRAIG